jgi:multidrug efflux system membrane fusion protein
MLTRRTVNAQRFAAEAAKSSVAKARALADQTSDTRDRMEPLLGSGFVAAEQLDQARTAERAAKVQLETAELDVKRAKAAISGVEALEARRGILKAEMAQAELNLEYAGVKAPCDGYVTGLRIASGQYAAAGHPLFTLVDTDRWYVVANFRETELDHIRPGYPALVHLLSKPGLPCQGVVESVGFGVFPDEGGTEADGLPKVPRTINWVRVHQRFPVKIRIPAADLDTFRLGESAVATVIGPRARTR